MAILKQLHDDESGIILEWIVGLFGLLMVILAYAFAVPLGNILINIFVENGAPLAQMLFFRQMAIWAFAIIGVLCMMYPFVASYVKVYDPGVDSGGWNR